MSQDVEVKFCSRCGWNDEDYGCICPSGEEVYQCEMYRYYHPDKVKQFEEDMRRWSEQELKEAK